MSGQLAQEANHSDLSVSGRLLISTLFSLFIEGQRRIDSQMYVIDDTGMALVVSALVSPILAKNPLSKH